MKIKGTSVYFLILISILFVVFNYINFTKIISLQNRLLESYAEVDLLQKKIDLKLTKVEMVHAKIKNLKKNIEMANNFLRSLSYK